MLFNDQYNELLKPSKGFYKSKGSKFITFAYIVYNTGDVNKLLNKIKQEENGANHYCYAYILNPDKSSVYSNDDGEPSNTAGKPILGQIRSKDLTNTLIVVVRYFGGVKLGISGLIKAYKESACQALENASIITKDIKESYKVIFRFEQTNYVMRVLKKYDVKILDNKYNEFCEVFYIVKKINADIVKNELLKNHKIKVKLQKI
ncbi:MAG: IMPACT family protein [Flavobacteriales bacterium]|jgi:uncharacterized YigZ family protein|tara:strand:- start:53350 stop:53961 length:612 start_codon:yes stop_codon:yes gene_type:complete